MQNLTSKTSTSSANGVGVALKPLPGKAETSETSKESYLQMREIILVTFWSLSGCNGVGDLLGVSNLRKVLLRFSSTILLVWLQTACQLRFIFFASLMKFFVAFDEP